MKLCSKALKVMASSITLFAANVFADTQYFTSISVGQFSLDETTLTPVGGAAQVADGESSPVLNLNWGIAEPNVRFMLEYYYQAVDLEDLALDYIKNSFYYSGYWTPNLYLKNLNGVLGAGVGFADLRLKGSSSGSFRDREEQYKFLIGAEYWFTDSLAVQLSFEKHFSDTFSDWVGDSTQWTFEDSDQTGVFISLNGRFD